MTEDLTKTAFTQTVNFYNENAKAYFNRTVVIDMHKSYDKFVRHLKPGAKILDAGCGSGRDSKQFLDRGYSVTAMDASIEMVKLSSAYTKLDTLHMSFEEMTFDAEFDGIWCSASLLHVPSEKLHSALKKIKRALKPNGILFISFMKGTAESYRGERFFQDMTQEKLMTILQQTGDLEILEIACEQSYEKNRDTTWIQALVKKSTAFSHSDCLFCLPNSHNTFEKIIAETELCYAIEDNFPVSKGHLLIISKQHFEHWFEAPEHVQQNIISLLNSLKNWLEKRYSPDGYNVGFNCTRYAGQTVPHLHVHIIPRYKGDCLSPEGGIRGVISHKQKYGLGL